MGIFQFRVPQLDFWSYTNIFVGTALICMFICVSYVLFVMPYYSAGNMIVGLIRNKSNKVNDFLNFVLNSSWLFFTTVFAEDETDNPRHLSFVFLRKHWTNSKYSYGSNKLHDPGSMIFDKDHESSAPVSIVDKNYDILWNPFSEQANFKDWLPSYHTSFKKIPEPGDSFYDIVSHKNEWGVPYAPDVLVGFTPPGSFDMAALICIHNDMYFFLNYILVLVGWFLFFAVYKNSYFVSPFGGVVFDMKGDESDKLPARFDSCSLLEIIWTIVPSFCLLICGYPGLSLLYSLDEHVDADFWVKAVGHQWYWTYEYPMFKNESGKWLTFDSTLVQDANLVLGQFNLPTFNLGGKYHNHWDWAAYTQSMLSPILYKDSYKDWVYEGRDVLESDVQHSPVMQVQGSKSYDWRYAKLYGIRNWQSLTDAMPDKVKPLTAEMFVPENFNQPYFAVKGRHFMNFEVLPVHTPLFLRLSEAPEAVELSRRYLDVDLPLILPAFLRVNVLVTSADVLHSWSVPALGIKIDACPGRVNQVSFQSEFDTVHYVRPRLSPKSDNYDVTKYAYMAWMAEGYRGQCSEFCGVGHGFMPIVVHTVPLFYMFQTMDFFWFDFQTHYFWHMDVADQDILNNFDNTWFVKIHQGGGSLNAYSYVETYYPEWFMNTCNYIYESFDFNQYRIAMEFLKGYWHPSIKPSKVLNAASTVPANYTKFDTPDFITFARQFFAIMGQQNAVMHSILPSDRIGSPLNFGLGGSYPASAGLDYEPNMFGRYSDNLKEWIEKEPLVNWHFQSSQIKHPVLDYPGFKNEIVVRPDGSKVNLGVFMEDALNLFCGPEYNIRKLSDMGFELKVLDVVDGKLQVKEFDSGILVKPISPFIKEERMIRANLVLFEQLSPEKDLSDFTEKFVKSYLSVVRHVKEEQNSEFELFSKMVEQYRYLDNKAKLSNEIGSCLRTMLLNNDSEEQFKAFEQLKVLMKTWGDLMDSAPENVLPTRSEYLQELYKLSVIIFNSKTPEEGKIATEQFLLLFKDFNRLTKPVLSLDSFPSCSCQKKG